LIGILAVGFTASQAFAIPLPTCQNCSIHGVGTGTLTIPDDVAAQIPIPSCHECAADITFDATQNGKNSAFGKLTVSYLPGRLDVIDGVINFARINDKTFTLKGEIIGPSIAGPQPFTLTGKVGESVPITFEWDPSGVVGSFTGIVTVTK